MEPIRLVYPEKFPEGDDEPIYPEFVRELTADDFVESRWEEPVVSEYGGGRVTISKRLTVKEEVYKSILPFIENDRKSTLFFRMFRPWDSHHSRDEIVYPKDYFVAVRFDHEGFLKRVRTRHEERTAEAVEKVKALAFEKGESGAEREIARVNEGIRQWVKNRREEFESSYVRTFADNEEVYAEYFGEPVDSRAGTVELSEEIRRKKEQLREMVEKRDRLVSEAIVKFWSEETPKQFPEPVRERIIALVEDGRLSRGRISRIF